MIEFKDKEDAYNHLKSLGFTVKDKKRNYKTIYYKGINTGGQTVECELIGYIITKNYETLGYKSC